MRSLDRSSATAAFAASASSFDWTHLACFCRRFSTAAATSWNSPSLGTLTHAANSKPTGIKAKDRSRANHSVGIRRRHAETGPSTSHRTANAVSAATTYLKTAPKKGHGQPPPVIASKTAARVGKARRPVDVSGFPCTLRYGTDVDCHWLPLNARAGRGPGDRPSSRRRSGAGGRPASHADGRAPPASAQPASARTDARVPRRRWWHRARDRSS